MISGGTAHVWESAGAHRTVPATEHVSSDRADSNCHVAQDASLGEEVTRNGEERYSHQHYEEHQHELGHQGGDGIRSRGSEVPRCGECCGDPPQALRA